MPAPLNNLRHCVYLIHFHLVVVTKYRRKCITKPMLGRLEEIFRDTLKKWGCELVEFNGESDHLHILMSVNPKVQPSKLVNNLKTVSSRLIRKDFAEHLNRVYRGKPVFWSRSYCLLACGGVPLSIIKQYIEQQAEID
ncbi:MAG: IS200/IS605 family transposase [Cyanobacteria bacterium J06635_15]